MKNLIVVFVIFSCFVNCNFTTSKKCDCENVDDCLSKYKFKEARELDGKDSSSIYSQLPKIIEAEVTFWISQKEFERAYETLIQDIEKLSPLRKNKLLKKVIMSKLENNNTSNLTELLGLMSCIKTNKELKDYPGESISEINQTFFECYLESANFYKKLSKNDDLNKLLSSLPNKLLIDVQETDITGNGGSNPDLDCEKLYLSIKRGLSQNQFIDNYRGCDYHYLICTYRYPIMEIEKQIKRVD